MSKITPDIREKILQKDVANIIRKLNDGKTLSSAERRVIELIPEKEDQPGRPIKVIAGLAGIAELINNEYGDRLGMACSKFLIARWRKGAQLPKKIPPFPSPKGNNDYDIKKCFKWVDAYIEAKKNSPVIENAETAAEAKARRELAKANREQRLDAREAGLLIERAVAERDAIGIVQRLNNAVTAHCEQEMVNYAGEVLKSLINNDPGAIAVVLQKLTEKAQDITTRRIEMFRTATEEFLKGVKE